MTSVPLGLVLTTMRQVRGLTQEELATLGGLNRKTVSRYECGERPLARPRFDSLAAVMGYRPDEVEAWLAAFRALVEARLEAPAPSVPGLPPEIDRLARQAVEELGKGLAAEAAPRFGQAALDLLHEKERKRAERLGKKLLATPGRLRAALFGLSPLYTKWPVVEWLCHASEQAAARDVKLALKLARVALQAAEACQGPEASRLQGYAWAYVGNALRVGNQLRGADEAFLKVWALWKEGEAVAIVPLAEWRLLDREASLRRDQRCRLDALDLLDKASAQAPSQAQGRILLNLAFVLEQLGESTRALKALEHAELLIAKSSDTRLLWVLRLNQAVNLVALDRAEDADALLPEIHSLVKQSDNDLDLIRTLWVQGRVHFGLGRVDDAVSTLQMVLTSFYERRLAFDAALAGLDLALAYLARGELCEVRALSEELTWVLDDPYFASESLAALRIFLEAARREEATADLIRETWNAVKCDGPNSNDTKSTAH